MGVVTVIGRGEITSCVGRRGSYILWHHSNHHIRLAMEETRVGSCDRPWEGEEGR